MRSNSMEDDRRYGEHPDTKALLEDIWLKEEANFRAVAVRRGVPSYDADDVVFQAYYAVWKLEIVGDIAEHLGLPKKAEPPAKVVSLRPKKKYSLRDRLAALCMLHLKYKCGEYHKRYNRERGRVVQLDVLRAGDAAPQPTARNIRDAVMTLGPLLGVSFEKLEEGDPEMMDKFIDAVAERAGLTDIEHRLVKFRAHNPDERDQDFDKTLHPYQIARIKKSAFDKIRRLFGLTE